MLSVADVLLVVFFLFIEIADDNLLLYQRQLEGAVVQVPKAIIIKKNQTGN
jgi:hypothetical protein